MSYKEKERGREATRERVRRYRDKQKDVTPDVTPEAVTPCRDVTPDVTPEAVTPCRDVTPDVTPTDPKTGEILPPVSPALIKRLEAVAGDSPGWRRIILQCPS